MTEAKRREDWNHTAAILGLLAEINRDPKKKSSPYRAEDFHPLHRKPKPVGTIKDVKRVFLS